MALYYTVSIEYHSGKRDPELLTVSNTDPATNTFTVMRWGESGRVARFDSSYGVNKLLLPVDLSQAQCNGQACGRGKYLVTAVTAHPWHASDAYPADGQPGAPENGWPAAGPGTIATEPMVGFTFMGEKEAYAVGWGHREHSTSAALSPLPRGADKAHFLVPATMQGLPATGMPAA